MLLYETGGDDGLVLDGLGVLLDEDDVRLGEEGRVVLGLVEGRGFPFCVYREIALMPKFIRFSALAVASKDASRAISFDDLWMFGERPRD